MHKTYDEDGDECDPFLVGEPIGTTLPLRCYTLSSRMLSPGLLWRPPKRITHECAGDWMTGVWNLFCNISVTFQEAELIHLEYKTLPNFLNT